jgi:hypothetical protein
MKNKIIALFIALGAVSSANAQFGGMGGMLGGGKSSGGGDVGVLADEFNRDASAINEVVSYSLLQIVAALGDKTQIANVKAVADNLSKTTDPKEKGSLQGTTVKDTAAVAEGLLKSADAKSKVEKMAPEMQQKVAKSIFAVGVASLRIPALMDKGKKIIEGVGSNPMNISKALPVKDGLAVFAAALPKMPSILTTGLQLMRDVKVDPGNPAADSKLESDKNLMVPES